MNARKNLSYGVGVAIEALTSLGIEDPGNSSFDASGESAMLIATCKGQPSYEVSLRIQGFDNLGPRLEGPVKGIIESALYPFNSSFYFLGNREADIESVKAVIKISEIQRKAMQ